eukprot:1137607-Pelagomonas_calceolata.AAC.5
MEGAGVDLSQLPEAPSKPQSAQDCPNPEHPASEELPNLNPWQIPPYTHRSASWICWGLQPGRGRRTAHECKGEAGVRRGALSGHGTYAVIIRTFSTSGDSA